MQEYEKRILQCVLAEKITPIDLKNWLIFHLLKPEFISQIHMVIVYSKIYHFFSSILFFICYVILLLTSWHFEIGIDKAIIVLKNKNVYSLGYFDDLHTAIYPKKIKELCGKNIKTFAHSNFSILALTEEGEVY